MGKVIDTLKMSRLWREAAIDIEDRKILVTDFSGTGQEEDLTEPPNCSGLGRIRHFRRQTSKGWPSNPLPIDPACKALGIAPVDELRAQVFQNSVCTWRCWYCYVPFSLLSANSRHTTWSTASDLLDLYLDQPKCPEVIVLSGGDPGLTPEWTPWMLREVQSRGLEGRVFIWSDDNLSTDFFLAVPVGRRHRSCLQR